MKKISCSNLSDIWEMRNFTVKEFFDVLSKHPELKFLLTAVGFWWIISAIVVITIGANVIYYLCRVFNLVLG